MKNSFIVLLLAFPAMLAAQMTYNFSYDKSGNVIAIKPVIKTVINDNINIGKNADGSLSVQVSPNPTSGLIAVALNIAGTSSADISIMSAAGGNVYQAVVNGTEAVIDISHLPDGIYFLKVTVGDESSTVEFIKS